MTLGISRIWKINAGSRQWRNAHLKHFTCRPGHLASDLAAALFWSILAGVSIYEYQSQRVNEHNMQKGDLCHINVCSVSLSQGHINHIMQRYWSQGQTGLERMNKKTDCRISWSGGTACSLASSYHNTFCALFITTSTWLLSSNLACGYFLSFFPFFYIYNISTSMTAV